MAVNDRTTLHASAVATVVVVAVATEAVVAAGQ